MTRAQGTQDRTRECNYPPPALGGAPCEGDNKETRECTEDPCPGMTWNTLSILIVLFSEVLHCT